MAVPMVRRDLLAGPVLSLRAKIVACGVITPSQPPDQTIGMSAISASPRRRLQQHAAERLVGEDAGEVVDAAIAFGLADHGDDLVGGELALADAGLEPGGVLHALQFDFGDFNGHSALSSLVLFARQAVRVHGTTSPRIIFS